MGRESFFGGVAAIFIVFLVILSSANTQTLIHGTVTDSILNPVENAIVMPQPWYYRTDTTDANGYYSLAGYNPQEYDIRFRHFDYFDTTIYNIQLGQDETVTVDVSMRHRPADDVAVWLYEPGRFHPLGADFWCHPKVIATNVGLQSQSFDIFYLVYPLDSTRIVFADTMTLTEMPGNSVDTLVSADSFMIPINFAYKLISYTALPGDENPSNDTSIALGTTYYDFYLIYGNRDGSIMPAHNNQLLEIPVWGVTPYGDFLDSISFMHNPLASDNNIITQRYGGFFPDTLVGRWDDRSFLTPDGHDQDPRLPEGFTNQSILGFAYLHPPRDEQNFFHTNGDTVLIATFRMRITSDTSIIGDTLQPFISGFNPQNGGIIWGMQDAGVIIPEITLPTLYIQSLAEWGCQYIPGDVNGDGNTNGSDVIKAHVYLKGAPPPPIDCNPPCTELSNPFYAAMDVNGSCTVNGIDITYFVSYLKGGPPLTYCPSCPPAGM